jgi:hypothetical protein
LFALVQHDAQRVHVLTLDAQLVSMPDGRHLSIDMATLQQVIAALL